MQMLSRRFALVFLVFPAIALADLNQTITLQSNTSINLETGATTGSPMDLRWNGSTLIPLHHGHQH
jgi:hypothetical protein